MNHRTSRQNLSFAKLKTGGKSMKKAVWLVLVFALGLCMVFATPEYAVEDFTGNHGGTFYISAISDPKGLNPAWASETSTTDITNIMFDMLLALDANGAFREEGNIAKSWETTPDGLGWIFHIRKGITWSDGHPLTAEDVYFTFKEVYFKRENNTGSTTDVLRGVDGNLPFIELIDQYTVKIWYSQPYAPGLLTIGLNRPLPKHIVEPQIQAGTWGEFWTLDDVDKLVVSGPFIVTEYIPDVRTTLSRNPHYYRFDKEGKRLPYLDQIMFLSVPSQDVARLKFEAGETDHYGMRPQDYLDLKPREAELNITVGIQGPDWGTNHLALNFNAKDPVKAEWFRNVHFRRALSYLVDRDGLVDNVLDGFGFPLYVQISPANAMFHNFEVEDKFPYPFSVEKAKEELRKGGFSWNAQNQLIDAKGNLVRFVMNTNAGNTNRERTGVILADNFSLVGIEAIFTPMDFNNMVQNMTASGDWEAILIGFTGTLDPNGGSNVWTIQGGLHYWNFHPDTADFIDRDKWHMPYYEWKIGELYRDQRGATVYEERRDMFYEVQELTAEYMPIIHTYTTMLLFGRQNRLMNHQPGSNSSWGWNLWALYKN